MSMPTSSWSRPAPCQCPPRPGPAWRSAAPASWPSSEPPPREYLQGEPCCEPGSPCRPLSTHPMPPAGLRGWSPVGGGTGWGPCPARPQLPWRWMGMGEKMHPSITTGGAMSSRKDDEGEPSCCQEGWMCLSASLFLPLSLCLSSKPSSPPWQNVSSRTSPDSSDLSPVGQSTDCPLVT